MFRRIRILPAWFVLVGAAVFNGGCASFSAPNVDVQTVAVSQTSDEATAIEFDLTLDNPNDEPLELIELNYTLSVDGTRVYSGRRDSQTTIPAGGSWTLKVPAVIGHSATGWSAQEMPPQCRYELRGSLLYITPGALADVLMDAGVYRPTAGFAAAGAVTLR